VHVLVGSGPCFQCTNIASFPCLTPQHTLPAKTDIECKKWWFNIKITLSSDPSDRATTFDLINSGFMEEKSCFIVHINEICNIRFAINQASDL
jgi:hypothetical protein